MYYRDILLRFEDRYGMYDIVKIMLGFNHNSSVMVDPANNIIVQRGVCNPKCYDIDVDTISLCVLNSIREIWIVCDTDAIYDAEIATSSHLQRYIDQHVLKPEFRIKIRYIPVAWCAETLMLYQFNDLLSDAEKYTVPKHIKRKLEKLVGYGVNVKKTGDILIPAIFRQRLSELDVDSLLDKEIINYILGREFHPMTLSEFKDWLDLAQKKFDENKGWWKNE